MERKVLKTLPVLVLSLWLITGCTGLEEKDFHKIASEGIDERLNSYTWAMEQFDGDRDGTPEVYIGTINNALCIQSVPEPGGSPPPERWQCPNELWDPDDWETYIDAATGPAYVYQGRYDEGADTWNWQRVWEPDFDTEVFAFRGARVFKDALYLLSNHAVYPAIWKTTDGLHYERASPPGMGGFGGNLHPPGFRGAQVFKGKLCVSSDQTSVIYCSSDPSTDPESWEQVNSRGFLDSGGEVHEQIYSIGKVFSATANSLTDENKSWLPKAHVGKLVRIALGTGRGQIKKIVSSQPSSLTIEGTWDTIPDSTSFYIVYEPEELDSARMWQLAVFNNHLYAIAFNIGGTGPTLWKSADPAVGNWTRVIHGGFGNPSIGFMTVRPFRDHLYIGTGTYPGLSFLGVEIQGCEILRVDAEDNVELVVGETRAAGVVGPDPVEPISGLERGFGHVANYYIWYTGEHNGWFYVGTFDSSGIGWDSIADPLGYGIPEEYKWIYDLISGPTGFDLWKTRDGVEWIKVTDTGFGEHDNYGVRNLMSTQWGLFLGTANAVDGFEIYLGRKN